MEAMNNITQEDLERVMKCEPLFVIGEEELSFVDLRHTMDDRDIAELFLAVTVDTWKDADNAYNATKPQVNDSLVAIAAGEAEAYKHREWARQRVAAANHSYHFWCDMVKKVKAELKKAKRS